MKKFQLSISALTKALIALLTPKNNTASITASEPEGARSGNVVCVPRNGGSRYNPPCRPGDPPVRVNSPRRPES